MLSYEKAKLVGIIEENKEIAWIEIEIKGKIARAINYKDLVGPVKIGDHLVVNTTAVELSLGTGGVYFVIFNYSNESKELEGQGHIMKLRYTPQQIRCLVAEEEESPHHEAFQGFESLEDHICIAGSLHSMLAPIVAMLKFYNDDIKINYIMTDGGALPISFSNTVRDLKKRKLIENTITIGNAFGGDLESTNIYTGLIAAKEILKADVTIITMGPGIVGTGTKYGFSGIEQGEILDAINTLGGNPIVVPRISFKDQRERHKGLSHHTRTILSEIAKTPGNLVLPLLEDKKLDILKKQVRDLDIDEKHEVIYQDGKEILKAMDEYSLKTQTMGRGYAGDKEFFLALGAVGRYVYSLLNRRIY